MRQFTDPGYTGTRITHDPEDFERRVNEHFAAHPELVDGYAPFCKHVFVPNFTDAVLAYARITDETRALLESGYEARTDKELPVLARWFPRAAVEPQRAQFLDVILYSREQIRIENAAMGNPDVSDAPWGIISVKTQDVDHELPMQPITMMRNALGVEEGGSGVPLDRAKYAESVEFWSGHAAFK